MTPDSIAWDLALLVAGLVLGAIVGFGFGEFAKRPKLKYFGINQSQPKDGYHTTEMVVDSVPGFLGYQSKPRLGFGRPRGYWRRRYVRWGRGFDRNPALDVSVWLSNASTNKKLGTLELINEHGERHEHPVVVESGGKIRAKLFEWEGDGPYAISRSWHSAPPAKYDAPAAFRVEINDRHGRLLRSRPFRVQRHPQLGWVISVT